MSRLDSNGSLRARPRGKSSDDSNLIPLINIVFLLLIFFMVAGQIQMQDDSNVQPPSSDTLEGGASTVVDIIITRQNEVMLDGEPLTLEQLEVRLQQERFDGVEHLQIKADRDVKAAELGQLLEVLRLSGMGRIRLLTQTSGS